MSYNLAQFFWFDLLTRTTAFYLPRFFENENKKTFTHFVCGGFAASLCVLTNQPIDTIRTRLISQGEPRLYLGIFDAFKKMYSKEGIKGFYRGTLPAIISNAPESAFRFSIYEILNSKWTKLNDQFDMNSQSNNETSISQSLICGSISGIFSKAVVYPFDLSKKRLQIQGFEEARKTFGKVREHAFVKFDRNLFLIAYILY
jgi:solute carrier family 25 (mitochondrial thiamine pyrophosphate transporter), member 19